MEQQLDKHYGIRLGIIVLIWFALGGTILNSDNQQSIFAALILYLLPLTLDYNSHLPKEKKNIRRQALGIWSTVILASILAGMSFSGINFEPLILYKFVKYTVWLSCLFYVALAGIDWVAYSSDEEREHRERIKSLYREGIKHETMVGRVEYYKGVNPELDKVGDRRG